MGRTFIDVKESRLGKSIGKFMFSRLKYATTGECPPGTTKGQTFVHDPHMTKGKRESAGTLSYLAMIEVHIFA